MAECHYLASTFFGNLSSLIKCYQVTIKEPNSVTTSPTNSPALQRMSTIELLSDVGILISSTFLIIFDIQSNL